MKKKTVHIIGIAGKNTAALAKLFKKDLGWLVTGSDQKKIYDPAKSYLKKHQIKTYLGYNEKNVNDKTDLIIIGGSGLIIDPNNPEYLKAKRLKLPMISCAQALTRYLIKPENISVIGAYGKTTITALLAWIFTRAGKNPSFFIGEQPLNFPEYIKLTNSNISIIEGDEYAYRQIDFDAGPKFHNYPTKYALLTSAQWEHKDVYSTEKEYVRAFQDFVKKIPDRGLLVAKLEGENVNQVASRAKCPVIYYSSRPRGRAEWKLIKSSHQGKTTHFYVRGPKREYHFQTPLFGKHNVENCLGAIALSFRLGIEIKAIQKALTSFRGVRRRLELISPPGKVYFYDDFAQSAVRIKAALEAIRTKHPKGDIIALFDPHAGFLQEKKALAGYNQAFAAANQVIVTRVTFKRAKRGQRVTGRDFVEAITKPKAHYLPLEKQLVDYVIKKTNSRSIIVFFSSGGKRGEEIKREILNKLKQK